MNVHDTLPEQISGASRQGYTSLNTPSPSETPRSQGHRTSHTLSGQVKSGQRWSGQNRPTDVARDLDVVLCRSLSGQV
jgi:hypothetical protein